MFPLINYLEDYEVNDHIKYFILIAPFFFILFWLTFTLIGYFKRKVH